MVDVVFDAPAEPYALVATARLNAPVEKVWTAHIEALYVQQWWAPAGYINREVEINATEGGAWRVVQSDPEGNAFSFFGRFEKVEPLRLLQCTFTAELFTEVRTHMRIEMSPTQGGTVLVTSHIFPDLYHRDGFIHLGGMDRMREPIQRLAALLRTMR
ncbi:SRPBCC family protein [Demequina lignilytica]|uniref:SRPBCC domain-containing protein n=1 Tax=Demequina lignilytica TaxID=3051663 RepID=A0AB35MHU9_9MICO|nr:SRPBCC domain-containing protein [Demequina sp. SYSU T0a273]MDN4483351.1 SRPBCC domain-containing protein [Demequina sp. SYSU T0a273]